MKQVRRENTYFIHFLYFFIEVQLIYNVVLLSSVQHSDSVIVIHTHTHIYIYIHIHIYIYTHIYVYFFRLFSLIDYYKILSRVPCAIQ